MAEFQEEVYIIEKQEITDDEAESNESPELDLENDPDLNDLGDLDDESDDDLNDFNQLKNKVDEKLAKKQKDAGVSATGVSQVTAKQAQPQTVERPVVIDDYIRNFLTKGKMTKTMNTFQTEWFELQKKGTFQDLGIGLITDINNKNAKMQTKIDKMKQELASAKVVADEAKSTWEKLRKERDYHKSHQDRVNGEKVAITANIKKIKQMHEDYSEKIEDVKKKLLNTTKEKALLKLEKDKLQKRAHDVGLQIKSDEDKV